MEKRDSFRALLGIKVLDVKDGYVKMSMRIGEKHTNIHGLTHGGIIFSLADCAFAEVTNFGDNRAVAVQVSINFIRPTQAGDTLTAEATRASEGKTFSISNITVSKENKLVALFTGLAYKIPSSKDQ
jgi:acyl-CoA thioesterase